MRADYLTRYHQDYHGGFARLSTGIVFTDGNLNYASSETGPGHTALGTGCYPYKSGILENNWYDKATKKSVYCVGDPTAGKVDGFGGGSSPKNLLVTAIGDWLKQSSPSSKVITASIKDRAAILMGGKHPDYAFWYSKSLGGFVTSEYYTHHLPDWVKTFNSSSWIEKNVPDAWTKSLPESVYDRIGPDEYPYEEQLVDEMEKQEHTSFPGRFGATKNPSGKKERTHSSFPHRFDKGKKGKEIVGTPYGDKIIVDFGIDAVKSEKLGQRGVTDLLCLSLSDCDYVGHAYGPDSHEVMDLLIKLDQYLGTFFASIDSLVGKDNYVVALSADHGVCPLPEFNEQFRHIPARRFIYSKEVKPKIDSLNDALKTLLHTDEDVIVRNSFINYTAAKKAGYDSVHIEKKVEDGFLSIDAFTGVYFRRELIAHSPSSKRFIQKFRNSYYAQRGEDFQLLKKENSVITSKPYGTSHGTPYDYDTHIPIVFWWNGVSSETVQREVHSIDIAPTLAAYAGFSFPHSIDGKVLTEVVQ